MTESTTLYLRRDCDALQVPSGQPVFLPKGTPVIIHQALGGSYTLRTGGLLVRLGPENADALGLIGSSGQPRSGSVSGSNQEVEDLPVDRDELMRQLSSCYDPEIPVDIVQLGLIYGLDISPHPDGGSQLEVRMTLTAPGCGMAGVLADEVKQKLLQVRGVRSVEVKLVFDPPWDASRMSEAAKLQLGLL
ncbi:iron-sulfur cluster assembly protein [Marinobacterium arenosum]|uniref:iron-sulfur cluster assembly protein n=1 Tax=Marinobacterium arenosum TaxID=2862496 RepID=UPI001C969F6B|nr:iron-sulfur cluster assembly protein [Marinobacterium arenosum]MBY4678860.1 iron-sulfur cluster assembly protein [Marinobacterium arenosum]